MRKPKRRRPFRPPMGGVRRVARSHGRVPELAVTPRPKPDSHALARTAGHRALAGMR
jgi:hypothetical protein